MQSSSPSSRITRCNYLHELILETLLRTPCKWTLIHLPDARTSHLRTLSKILEPASAPRPAPLGKVPEGAAHDTALSGNVNTLNQDFLPFPAPPDGPEGEGARIVHGSIGFGKGVGA